MDLQQLESFVRVAELGSLTRAALVAGVSQPTLSRHIRLLELELKSHLLVRTRRGVELTESGKCLLSYGNAILKLTRQARADIQALREQPTGRLTVGLPPRIAHVLTPELVKQFRKRYPEASISVSEGLSVALREDLILGKIEIALLFDPPPSPRLEYRSLYREDMVLCGRPKPAFPLPARLAARELERYPVLVPSIPNAVRNVIEAGCRPHGIKLNVVAEVDAVHTLLKLALSGQGYAIVPRSAAPIASTVEGGPFRISTIGSPRMRNNLVLATARERPLSQLAQGTVELLVAQDIGRLLDAGRRINGYARRLADAARAGLVGHHVAELFRFEDGQPRVVDGGGMIAGTAATLQQYQALGLRHRRRGIRGDAPCQRHRGRDAVRHDLVHQTDAQRFARFDQPGRQHQVQRARLAHQPWQGDRADTREHAVLDFGESQLAGLGGDTEIGVDGQGQAHAYGEAVQRRHHRLVQLHAYAGNGVHQRPRVHHGAGRLHLLDVRARAEGLLARPAQHQHRHGRILRRVAPDAAQLPLGGHVQRVHALRAVDDDLVDAAFERTIVDTHAGLFR